MKKSINIFGKKVSILLMIALISVTGIASAALLSEYFTSTGSVEVKRALEIDEPVYSGSFEGGEQARDCATVTNYGDSPILVELETVILNETDVEVTDNAHLRSPVGGVVLPDINGNDEFEVICMPGDTTICISAYIAEGAEPMNYTIVTTGALPSDDLDYVILENKNPSTWEPITTDGINASVIYTNEGVDFNYSVLANGLTPNVSYDLIYYADPYPSSNGILIATGTVGSDFEFPNLLKIIGTKDMPSIPLNPDDPNSDPNNHDFRGAPDYYQNSCGAKLWIVPSTSFTEGTGIIGWAPTTYLYETELASYTEIVP